MCDPNPCLHGGTCIQISQHPGFRCRCEGSGYYGLRCDRGEFGRIAGFFFGNFEQEAAAGVKIAAVLMVIAVRSDKQFFRRVYCF